MMLLRALAVAVIAQAALRHRSLDPDGARLSLYPDGSRLTTLADAGSQDAAGWESLSALGSSLQKARLEQSDAEASSQVLVTTGYWHLNRTKRGDGEQSSDVYSQCMQQVLSLNASLSLYGDAAGLAALRAARAAAGDGLSAPTTHIRSVDDLGPCGYARDALMARGGEPGVTNQYDVPSLALGCLWDGKPELLRSSAQESPDYRWYAWLDVCMGHGAVPFPHGAEPWPSAAAVAKLPADRIVVSESGQHSCEDCASGWTYCHCIAGTAFVVPASLVEPLAANFSRTVQSCISAAPEPYVCLSDQVIFTKLFLEAPTNFQFVGQGYGMVATDYLTSA